MFKAMFNLYIKNMSGSARDKKKGQTLSKFLPYRKKEDAIKVMGSDFSNLYLNTKANILWKHNLCKMTLLSPILCTMGFDS